MKLSIGHRLFLAVWLTVLAIGALGIELVRWQLLDNFSGQQIDADTSFLDRLGRSLEAKYRLHDDWSFLPQGSSQRKVWLREEYERTRGSGASFDPASGASSVAYRIGLMDSQGQYLAGVLASPAMVAFASIDRFARPLVVDGRPIGALVVARPQNPGDALAVAFLIDQQAHLALVAAAALLLSALVAVLFAVYFRRPVVRLVTGARRLEDGLFNTRIELRRSDELGELALAFNRMAARLEDAERIRRQWIADTSHELRTPLAVLQAQLESLQDGVRPMTAENLALMERQIRSLSELVDDLYELARGDLGQGRYDKAPHDIWRLIGEVFADFTARFRAAGLHASLGDAPERCVVNSDPSRMRQVIANLFENSVRYTDAGGQVSVAGGVVGNELHIVIEDSAPGVPEAAVARLGERFFRVDDSRSREFGGAGLGLALCRQIVAAHDGRLVFRASPLGGLGVTIALPLDDR